MKLAMACCSAAMPTLVLMPQYMQDKGCILAPEAVLDAVIIRCIIRTICCITLYTALYYMLYYTTCCTTGCTSCRRPHRMVGLVGGEWKNPTYLI